MGRTQRRRRALHKASNSLHGPAMAADVLHTLHVQLHARGWLNGTQLTARNYAETGRGLCSKRRHFAAGDELIRLPAHCLISIATLESDKEFKALFNREQFHKDTCISFQALMACYLMHQQHRHECRQAACEWDAYLDTLPPSYTTPYFCSLAELQCLPEALLERTVAQNRLIRDYYLTLKTLLAGQGCEDCGQSYGQDIWTLPDFRRAYFAVNTRSVYLNASPLQLAQGHFQALIKDNANLALAPFLDLFNHSDRVQTSAELRPAANGKDFDFVLTLVAAPTPTIKPHAQLCISYGALPNLKLLTDYGFYVARNAHDYFEFSLLDIEQLIRHTKKLSAESCHRNIFKFIREHNLCDQMFVHVDDGCSHNLRVVLHLIFKQQSHFDNVLNQIAFGAAEQFDDVQPELAYLVDYKIGEYERYAAALARLPDPSASGIVARGYLLECVRYLAAFQALHCAL